MKDERGSARSNKKLLLTTPHVSPAGFAVRNLEQKAKPADTAGLQQNFALGAHERAFNSASSSYRYAKALCA